MSESKVSVITSTYNRAPLLRQAIASVLEQTFTNFEMLIIDDGSQDDTCECVTQFGDARLRYFYQANAGLAAGRNTGIRHAQGVLVAFLDDDDLLMPDKLAAQVAFMQEHPDIGWTATGYWFIDSQGRRVQAYQPWQALPALNLSTWLVECPTCPSAVMVRREWLERVGGFDSSFRRVEDWDLWLRLAHAGCKMDWVRNLTVCYRLHEANMVRDAASQTRAMIAMLDKFYSMPGLHPAATATQPGVRAGMYLSGSLREYAVGQVGEAAADLERAIVYDPTLARENRQRFVDLLVAWSTNPLVEDPLAYVRSVFDNLPASAPDLHACRRSALAQAAMAQVFSAHRHQEPVFLRRMLRIALVHDPSWIRNRGVRSIALEALFGSKILAPLRSLAHRFQDGHAR